MLNNTCKFKLEYDGPALAQNSISVSDLAPALFSLNSAFSALNELINKNDAKVSLRIQAFNGGCFGIDLVLVQDLLQQVGNFLIGNVVTGMCNAATLVEVAIDILNLKKWLRGHKPSSINPTEDGTKVIFSYNSQTKIVNYYVYEGWKNSKVNASCSRIINPLKTNGIDSVKVESGEEKCSLAKEDVDAICATIDESVLTDETTKKVVQIETVAFKENAKWRIKLDNESPAVFASITDKNFLRNVAEGAERFGNGDVLLVELQTKQFLKEGSLTTEYIISKVLEHKPSAEQLQLFS
jgi:uncharacterized protein (UPF0212 family)